MKGFGLNLIISMYNILIKGYGIVGWFERFFELLELMLEEDSVDVRFNVRMFNVLV